MPSPGRRRAIALGWLLAASSLLLPLLPASGAPSSGEQPAAASPTGRYFVSLEQDTPQPGDTLPAENPHAETIVAQFEDAVAELEETSSQDLQVTSTYHTLWTGAVVEADSGSLGTIETLPGVSAVYPVLPVELPTEIAAGDDTAAATQEESALQSIPPGVDGRGVRVAVIDSGVDLDHPTFGGTGRPGTTRFPNTVVVGGWDFVGDDYNNSRSSPSFNPTPVPDGRPQDCQGHGTGVASKLAGRPVTGAPAQFSAAAPGASLLAYRVFGCQGSTSADIMLSAMERAKNDGAQVVNFSVAVQNQSWPDYPTAVGAQRLVDSGVSVVAAMGNAPNSQPNLFGAGAPASAPDVISVGSATATTLAPHSQWGPSATLGITPSVLAAGVSQTVAAPIVGAQAQGNWSTQTGTSYATPEISGQVARLLQRYPAMRPSEVTARVVGSALPLHEAGLARRLSLTQQGSGRVNPSGIHSAPVIAQPARLELGETSGAAATTHVNFRALSAGTYTFAHEPSVAMISSARGITPDSPSAVVADARVSLPGPMTLGAGNVTTLPITITPPAGQPAGTIFGGFVTVRDASGTVRARLPYQGMVGSFTDLPLWRNTLSATPRLARVSNCDRPLGTTCVGGNTMYSYVESDGRAFSMVGWDVPTLLIGFEFPASEVRVDVLRVTPEGDVPVDRLAAPVVREAGVARWQQRQMASWRWDGSYRADLGAYSTSEPFQAPNGTYRLKVTGTRALASGQPGDREEWVSPRFEVRSPAVPPASWLLGSSYGPVADIEVRYGSDVEQDVYVGDWTGSGQDGIAYRRGNIFYLRDTATSGIPDRAVAYGRPGDTVYVGDWNGDGRDTFAVRRGNTFHISNSLDGGQADLEVPYGRSTDEVLVGDWNGDGRDTLAVRRANRYFFNDRLQSGPAQREQDFGRVGDIALSGNFNGRGGDTLTLRRGNMVYVKNDFTSGPADREVAFGRPTDVPLVGTWRPGANDTLGVYRRG